MSNVGNSTPVDDDDLDPSYDEIFEAFGAPKIVDHRGDATNQGQCKIITRGEDQK